MVKAVVVLSAMLAGLFLATGCGGEKLPEGMPALHDVAVTVTQNGTPVADATVVFQSQKEGAHHASGTTDAKGVAVMRTDNKFDGVPPGEYSVKITKTEAQDTGKTEVNDDGEAVPMMTMKNTLPEKYASFDTSELTATVGDDSEDIPFDVSK